MVGKSGNELTVVDASFGSELSPVMELVILGFLSDDVEDDAHFRHVGKYDFPLIQLTAIESEALIIVGIGPYVLPISNDVLGEEIDDVHAL